MVVGKDFAWGHLGKTAGDATLRLFQLFPELIVFADPATDPDKHARFHHRWHLVAGKRLTLNIRRLPSWVVSFAVEEANTGVRSEPNTSELVRSGTPDIKLDSWLGDERIEIDRWLRMEHLIDDFLAFIGDFTEIGEDRRRRAESLPLINSRRYHHDVSAWLTCEQVAVLYERNPVWTSLERRVYGDLAL